MLVTTAGTAIAQPAGDIQLDPFRPAIDSRGYLTINASQTLGHKEVSFGLGSLSWGHKLLAFQGDDGAEYLVNDVITATLIAAVGFRVGPADLQFGASVPLTIVSGDRGPDDPGVPSNPNDDRNFKIDGQGVGRDEGAIERELLPVVGAHEDLATDRLAGELRPRDLGQARAAAGDGEG